LLISQRRPNDNQGISLPLWFYNYPVLFYQQQLFLFCASFRWEEIGELFFFKFFVNGKRIIFFTGWAKSYSSPTELGVTNWTRPSPTSSFLPPRFSTTTRYFTFLFCFFGSLTLISQIIAIRKGNISAWKRNLPNFGSKRKIVYYFTFIINNLYLLHIIYFCFCLLFFLTKKIATTPIINIPAAPPIQRGVWELMVEELIFNSSCLNSFRLFTSR